MRRCDREERWSVVTREWGRRRQGKWRGKEEGIHASSFLFFIVLFERGQHMLPPFLFVSFHFSSNGAALAAPILFQMGTAHAVPNSFRSERGQHSLPPFLFFLFRTGGQRESHTLPPFLSVSIGGSVYPTRCPLFLLVSTRDSVNLTCHPHFVFFTPQ